MQEEIILEIFNSERNTLFIQTQNRILLIDLSDKPNKANVKGDMYMNKLAAKDMLLNIRNSPMIFQSIKLDNYLNYYIENDALMMRLDFITETQIFDYKRNIEKTILAFKNSEKTVKLIDREKDIFAIIHTDEIQTLKMDDSMDKIVTICLNGQNISVWNINDLNDIKTEPEMKFYRGKNPCIITSISFNRESSLLALSTDKGTIHIFDIKDYNKNVSSAVSWIPFASSLTNYANYKWSFGQIHLDQYVKDSTSIQNPVCQFNSSDLLVVCTPSGKYFEFFLDVSSSKFACNCIKSNLLLSEKFFSERCYFEQDHVNFEVLVKELIDSSNVDEEVPKKAKKKKSSKIVTSEKFIFPNVINLLRNEYNKDNMSEEKLSLKEDIGEKGDKEEIEEKKDKKEEQIEIFDKIEIVEKENREKEKIEEINNEEILGNDEKEEEIEVLKTEVELKIGNDEVIEDNTLVEEDETILDEEKVVEKNEKVEKEIKDTEEVEIQYIEEDLGSEDNEVIGDNTQFEDKIMNKEGNIEKEIILEKMKEEVEIPYVEEVENDNDEIVDDHIEDEDVEEFEVDINEGDDEEITDTTGTEEEEHNEPEKEKMGIQEEKKDEKENNLANERDFEEENFIIEEQNEDFRDYKEDKQNEDLIRNSEVSNDKGKREEKAQNKQVKELGNVDLDFNPSPVLEQATKNFVSNQISDNRKTRTKSIARKPSKGHRTPGSSETKGSPIVVGSPSQPQGKYVPQGVSNQFKLPPISKIVLKPTKKGGGQSVPLKNN
eukprot:TRINITY_DN1463_c0_g1_i2.p1 TRINITY_DN1463_c0_g1~~TRINITY_DN1463_c0_g1_i2.p1  ORF type:complete len:772 (-),score=252.78 TRINITY_DN1463_c0_g1_i2:75-2390(-)